MPISYNDAQAQKKKLQTQYAGVASSNPYAAVGGNMVTTPIVTPFAKPPVAPTMPSVAQIPRVAPQTLASVSSAPTTQISDLQNKISSTQKILDQARLHGYGDDEEIQMDSTGNVVPKQTTSGGNDILAQISAMLQPSQAQQDYSKQFADVFSRAYTPSPEETAARTQYATATTDVQKTQAMIDSLEQDVKQSLAGVTQGITAGGIPFTNTTQGGAGPLTSNQMNLQVAAKQAPLARLLAAQSQAANVAGTNLGVLQAGRTDLQSELPILQQMAAYQSPQEKFSQQIAQEEMMKQLGLGSYAGVTKPTYQTVGKDQTLVDPSTGEVIYQSPTTTLADKVLSPSEAETLGVPYGTTESQAAAKGIIPAKAGTAGTTDKVLSPTEAQTLGVPYGTTESQAAAKGITPQKGGLTTTQQKAIESGLLNARKALDALKAKAHALTLLPGLFSGVGGAIKTQLEKGHIASQAVDEFTTTLPLTKQAFASGLISPGRSMGMRYILPDIEKSMPNLYDSKDEVETKLNNLESILADYETTYKTTYAPEITTPSGNTVTFE